MATININRNNDDMFYRYKMPSLLAKVEGKGNGIKTVIVNMVEIGKALQRPPSYPCKYFGCELGAQTQMDPKTGRYIVNGAHESSKLQDLLDGFIKNFVLCEQCENPETALSVSSSKGRIRQTCQACGHNRIIANRHKLTTFILKNPPGEESAGGASTSGGKKEGKKGRGKEAKKQKKKDGEQPQSPSSNADEEFDLSTEVNGNQNGSVDNKEDKQEDDDEDWSMDTSKEAVKARLEVLTESANALALNDDLEKTPQERLNLFFKFVEKFKKDGGVAAIARALPKIKAEAERLDVMDTAAGIMAELLYTENLVSQISEYRPIMLHFVVDNKKAQKTLLGAFEILVGKVYPDLITKTPHILKAFYDEDIIDEDVIIEWNDKVSKKHVGKEKAKEIREKAKPIIDWLKTAEEESSEEEEGVEVVYSQEATPSQLTVVNESPHNKSKTNTEEETQGNEEDVDIDAI